MVFFDGGYFFPSEFLFVSYEYACSLTEFVSASASESRRREIDVSFPDSLRDDTGLEKKGNVCPDVVVESGTRAGEDIIYQSDLLGL